MSKSLNLSETQSKLILERINETEKSINLISCSIEEVLRKESKFGTKLDELSNKFKLLSENELYDESLGKIYKVISDAVVHLADIESNKIARIDDKFLNELMQCELICRNARDEAKNFMSLRDFEMNKRSQINANRKSKKNNFGENEIMLSNIQISKILKEILTTAEKFENQKNERIKEIMSNFILIQLKYHTSGIDILTKAFENLKDIGETSHSEQFSTELKNVNKQLKKNIEQDNLQAYRFPFMRALSRFSHSTSNIDQSGKDMSVKKRTPGNAQSLISLNSLETNELDGMLQNISYPTDLSKNMTQSESDESDIDEESSNMEPTDTENLAIKKP